MNGSNPGVEDYKEFRVSFTEGFIKAVLSSSYENLNEQVQLRIRIAKNNDPNLSPTIILMSDDADEEINSVWKESGILSNGYRVSTIGINELVIKRYIEHQEQEDKQQTQLVVDL